MARTISRKDAATKIRTHWLENLSREELLAAHEPTWDRMRNYEIETLLDRTFEAADYENEDFEGRWVISEWCPFNGVHCAWVKHCPVEDIDAIIANWEANPDALRRDGINPEIAIGHLKTERRKRVPSPQSGKDK
jgi:hypothetical protein